MMPIDKTANHERIIVAAKKEFLEYGFLNASMRRIAMEAGMSASGLYKHFSSKEEMFASLIDPVLDGFWAMYFKRDHAALSLSDSGDIGRAWEEARKTQRIMKYVYEHYDEFKLIICKAQGTQYEDFLHEMAIREEQATFRYLDELKKRGIKVSSFREEEFHLLVTVNVDAVFQAVKHGFSYEKAMHYSDTLDRFFLKGWRNLFGL